MVVVFLFQCRLDIESQFPASFAGGRDQTDVRHLEFAIVVHPQALRFIIAILHDAKTDEIIAAEALFVIEHPHGVGAHDRTAGRARTGRLDRGSSRGEGKRATILREDL